MSNYKCDGCGKFHKASDLTRQPYTQADYLFSGSDPAYLCGNCQDRKEVRHER